MKLFRLIPSVVVLALPLDAPASFHLMHITEVYSNADGTKQFIEVEAESAGQTQLSATRFVVQNADGTITTVAFDITTNLPTIDADEHFLAATAAAQAELGFTADYTIPANSIILTNGRIRFQDDSGSTIVDALAYGNFTGSNAGFGTPAPALPTTGGLSLTRTADTGGNSADFSAQPNSPTNNAGQTGTLGASSTTDWFLY